MALRADGLPELWDYYTVEEKALALAYADVAAPLPKTFVEFVNQVRPGYIWYTYAQKFAAVLQLVADGVIKRLMVFAPPQLGKSELVSRIFPAYLLYRFPDRWYGLTSYGASLAYTFSRNARTNYRSSLDSESTGGETEGVEQWETGKGGGLWAAGAGGAATGKPAHGVIIDDPVKGPIEAASETTQATNMDWLDQVIIPRTLPHDGFIVLVQTRWNLDDMAGQLLRRENGDAPEYWHIVCFEAIKEDGSQYSWPPTCTVEPDWRKEGESVCPERLPLAKLEQVRRGNKYVWNALYQQQPTAKEGGTFKRGWFEIVPKPGPTDYLVVGRWWDLGATEKSGSYTVGVKMGRTRLRYYVIDVVRGQWGAGERDARIRQTAELDGHSVRVYGPQDPGQAGKTAAAAFRRLLDGFSVQTIIESGDKETRADPFASASYTEDASSGIIKLVRGEWIEPYLAELAAFPFSGVKDQVDASANMYNVLAAWRPPVNNSAGTRTVWTG